MLRVICGGMEEGGCVRSVEGMVGGYWEDAAGMQGYIMGFCGDSEGMWASWVLAH